MSARAQREAGDDLNFQDDSGLDDEYEEHDSHEYDTGSPRSGAEHERAPGTLDLSRVNSSPPRHSDCVPMPEHVREPKESSKLSRSETLLSSPSLYASTEMSHSPPRSVGSALSDTQRFTLNHQPVIFVSPAFAPSDPSAPAPTEAFEPSVAASIPVPSS
jgi:hypothetical protein